MLPQTKDGDLPELGKTKEKRRQETGIGKTGKDRLFLSIWVVYV